MAEDDLTSDQIRSEFERVGITWRTFAQLVDENRGLDAAPQTVAIALGSKTWALLRSLPDGAGEERFIAAFKSTFPRWPLSDGPAGA
jgi:ABC-type spermidine/putrescine transport system permease subunit II